MRSDSRKRNAALISLVGIVQQIVQTLCVFAYRTVFLHILAKEYLGLNGLFSNVLQILSLAELGIGRSILYRMYKPFADGDERKIAQCMNFYKTVYRCIFIAVLAIGMGFLPFLSKIVNLDEVPGDVNLYFVYFLFVAESASSYLFIYRQALLTANQKGYLVSVFTIILNSLINIARIAALVLTRNYEIVLTVGLAVQVLMNFCFSEVIRNRYKRIFAMKEQLPFEEKKSILQDTGGLLCHRIGSAVVNGTDNIVLTKVCGLAAVGIYSNYATLLSAINGLVTQLLGNLAPVVGNYFIKNDREKNYRMFLRLDYANLWISAITTTCIFSLINPFIRVWLDDGFVLSTFVVSLICLQHYLQTTKIMSNTAINACGLFSLDKVRPLFESFINLVVSIVLAKYIGIAGVFVGTVVSGALTYYWREPYLLFKRVFHASPRGFILSRIKWGLLTILNCLICSYIQGLFPSGWVGFFASAFTVAVTSNVIVLAANRKNEFKEYYLSIIVEKLKNRIR